MKTIYLSGIVGYEITPDKIREDINSESKEKLRIIINSPGGYVDDGFEIYNILKAYKGEIEIVIGVMAGSIASYIAMVVPIENRKAFKNSSMMLHEASAGIWGRARELLIYAERLEGLNNIIAEAYSEGLGISKEASRTLMNEDFYMTGWESLLENNIISDVIDIEDVEIPKKEEDEDAFLFFELLAKDLNSPINESILKSKMYDAEEKVLKDFDTTQKAAAIAKEFKPVDPDENKINQEGEMKFLDFLKANPEAKAEYDESLISAKADGAKDANVKNVDEIRISERKNICATLKIAGVKLTDDLIKALNDGTNAKDYAFAEMSRRNEIRTGEKEDIFGKLKNDQTPGDQGGELGGETDAEIEAKAKEEVKLIGNTEEL